MAVFIYEQVSTLNDKVKQTQGQLVVACSVHTSAASLHARCVAYSSSSVSKKLPFSAPSRMTRSASPGANATRAR